MEGAPTPKIEKNLSPEKAPLRDFSIEIEALSNKERTKQILDGMAVSGHGVMKSILFPIIGTGLVPMPLVATQNEYLILSGALAGLIAGIVVNPLREDGVGDVRNGMKMISRAIKGQKFHRDDGDRFSLED